MSQTIKPLAEAELAELERIRDGEPLGEDEWVVFAQRWRSRPPAPAQGLGRIGTQEIHQVVCALLATVRDREAEAARLRLRTLGTEAEKSEK